MSATVVRLAAIADDEPMVAVPALHLRRLLAIEAAAQEALTYQRPSGAIRASQAKRLRAATERKC